MRSLEAMVQELTDEDLQKCFLEIVEWRQEGVLSISSAVRKLWNDFKEENNQNTFPIHTMPEAIFFEIAKRKYREVGIEV